MYVNYNPSGVNALRRLQINTKKTQGSLQKLASGYAINKAADNAAGLAVSEKMRAQITGLDKAIQNARDGSRLIQTGEGALQEIHTMLNRMVTLSTQSANGTYDDEVDRTELQVELDELRTEIDRIAQGTNFNGIKLFQNDGDNYETGATQRRIQEMFSEQTVQELSFNRAKKVNEGAVNIIYIDNVSETGTSIYNNRNTPGANTQNFPIGATDANDIDIVTGANGQTTKLREVLKKQISCRAL